MPCRFNPIRIMLNNFRWGIMDAKVCQLSTNKLCEIWLRVLEFILRSTYKANDPYVLQFAGENFLRESGASYTVVRPGGLTNDPPGKFKLQAGKFWEVKLLCRRKPFDQLLAYQERIWDLGSDNLTFAQSLQHNLQSWARKYISFEACLSHSFARLRVKMWQPELTPWFDLTGQRDKGKGGKISRADVAAVCVAALTNPKARNVTLEISSDTKSAGGRNDVNQVFDTMQPKVFD